MEKLNYKERRTVDVKNNLDYSRGGKLILVALSCFPTHIQISLSNVTLLYNR